MVSAVGDGIWHMHFGVEVGIEAQFSPTHIGLFLYVSAFREDAPSLASGRPGTTLAAIPAHLEITRVRGLVGVQVTNLLLLGPLLLLIRRWRPPFGTATLLFGMVAVLVAIVDEFARGEVVVAALAGGLAADWLIVGSARWPNQTQAHRVVAIGTPSVLWACYFLGTRTARVRQDIGRPASDHV